MDYSALAVVVEGGCILAFSITGFGVAHLARGLKVALAGFGHKTKDGSITAIDDVAYSIADYQF